MKEILLIWSKWFIETFKPRTLIAFSFYATFIYLIGHKIDIPPALNSIVSTLMGFYFGQKTKEIK